jgi:cell division septal protein FtsQ
MTAREPISGEPRLRYWRSRANRRVRKARMARNLLQWAAILLVNGVVATALIFAGVRAFWTLTGSAEFDVEKIELVGVERASSESIHAALDSWAGRSLLEMDLATIEETVSRDPWVLRSSVKRVLPGTLRISVVEREPTALAVIKGYVHIVDGTGYVIGAAGGVAPADLPVLTGLDGYDRDGLIDALGRGTGMIERLRLAAPAFVEEISEIDMSKEERITVRTVTGGPRILLDPRRIERNVLQFLETRPQLERRLGDMEYVDLRWSDRISVMPAVRTTQLEGR